MGFTGIARGKEQGRLGLPALSLLHFEDEVLVGNGCAGGELHMPPSVRQTALIDHMRDALDGRSIKSRIQINRDGDVMAGAVFRMPHWWRDARCVRHRVRIHGPSSSGVA